MPTYRGDPDAQYLYDSDVTEPQQPETEPQPEDGTIRPHDGIPTASDLIGSGPMQPHDGYPYAQVHRASSAPALKPGLIDATIYLADAAAAEDVKAAFTAMIEHFRVDIEIADLPIIGSWFQRFTLRVRSAFHEPAVTERLTKLERALEIQLVDKPQSQVNAADGGAVAGLITALDKTENAMITIGTILLVKANGVVAVRNLSVSELRALERNPSWTMNPGAAMRYLQELQNSDQANRELAAAIGDGSPQATALQDNAARS